MYTWGYIKAASLAKLDLNQDEALEIDLTNRFVYYANEVITQVSSTVKPKKTFHTFKVYEEVSRNGNILIIDGVSKENLTLNEDGSIVDSNNTIVYYPCNYDITMPSDFVSFGDDVCTIEYYDFMYNKWLEECHDDCLSYIGYNKVSCKQKGTYKISYNARWYDFSNALDDTNLSFIPTDILDCIPSYIAHQCYKIDDEYKSSVFRNEYEIFLSRIDNTDFNNTKTFKIEGDW